MATNVSPTRRDVRDGYTTGTTANARQDGPAFFDRLRAREFARLDQLGEVYLDYTGGALCAESQLSAHFELLRHEVFGNPHSDSPSASTSTQHAEQARQAMLRFFDADPQEYALIWTANASGALKLLGEAFPFAPGGTLLLTFDNHNSVNGIREFARARGARTIYTPIEPVELRIDGSALLEALQAPASGRPRLFAFPAQSNFSGVQHDLEWIDEAQRRGWSVLLDAAAFVPSNRLDLARHRPDFVVLSVYKIMGHPTGVGCLLARREALAGLHRPWFAGGTVTVASVGGDAHYLDQGEAAWEDGTINYLSLPAVEHGLRFIETVGVQGIHEHVAWLTAYALGRMQQLRHPNGAPLLQIYGPRTLDRRGGTIAFNVLDPNGAPLDFRVVEHRAGAARISLRSGCFCNPGVGEVINGIGAAELRACFASAEYMSFDQFLSALDGRVTGAVRMSFGLANNTADIERCIELLATFAD